MSNATTAFRIPLNFDRIESVCLLTHRTGRADLAYRIWLEWAQHRRRFRPLTGAEPVDWTRQAVTFLIERFVEWSGPPGGLIACGLECGFFRVVDIGGERQLELTDFWDYNADLDPRAQSKSSRGGAALSVQRGRRQAMLDARRAVQLAAEAADGPELFTGDGALTREQRQEAVALIIEMDRACRQVGRREFPEDAIGDAAAVIARHPRPAIESVLVWLIGQRENPEVPMIAERLLRDWDRWAAHAAAQ